MAKRPITSQPHLLTAWLALGLSFGAPAAYASDPLPGDAIAPPANVNIALFYNDFTDAGSFGSADGGGTYQREYAYLHRYRGRPLYPHLQCRRAALRRGRV